MLQDQFYLSLIGRVEGDAPADSRIGICMLDMDHSRPRACQFT